MAVEPDYLGGNPPAPPAEESGSLMLDAGKAFGKRVLDVHGAVTGGIADAVGSQPGEPVREIQKLFHAASDAVDDTISPANRSWRDSAFVPEEGQKSVFASPGKATVMKLAAMGPDILGAFLLPTGLAGVAAGSGIYGTLGVLEQLDKSRRKIETLSDDDLQEKSFIYKNLRAEMGEAEAREKLIKGMDDPASLTMTGVGNAAGGGFLAHALRGTAGKGFLKGIGVGGADGLAGGAASGAGTEGASQAADIRGGFSPKYDPDKLALAILNSTLEGGFLGGAFGAAGSMGSRRDRARDRVNGTEVPPGAPDPAQAAALEADNEPDTTTASPPGVTPPAAPPTGAEAPTGTLAQQIEAERARQAAEEAAANAAKAAPPGAAAPPAAPAVVQTGPEPGIPPMPRGVVPPPAAPPAAPAAPVATAGPVTPNPRTQQVIPPPPTDTMLSRGKLAPVERTAVPLEEEAPAPAPPAFRTIEGPPTVAEAQAAAAPTAEAAAPAPAPKKAGKGRIKEVVIKRDADAPKPLVAEDTPAAEAPVAPTEVKPAPEVPRGMPKGSTYLGDNANGEAVWQYPEGGPRASRGADNVLRVMAVGDEITPPRFEVVGEKKAELTFPEPLAPAGKTDEADAPVAQDRLTADKAAPAKVVRVLPDGKKVLRTENSWAKQQEQERKEREEELETERKNAAEANRKVVARKENKTLPNENKAREYITSRHPKTVEDVTRVGTVESNALKGDEAAQREIIQTASKLVADAKEAGVEIPQRTTRGANTNPTPYTSHLIETNRFLAAVKKAASLKTAAKRKAAIDDAFTNYITAERALRSGDLQAAAARRIAANEAANAGSTRAKNENATRAEGEQADAKKARDELGDEKDADDYDASAPLSEDAPPRKAETPEEELARLMGEQKAEDAADAAAPKKKKGSEEDEAATDALDDVVARDDTDVDRAERLDLNKERADRKAPRKVDPDFIKTTTAGKALSYLRNVFLNDYVGESRAYGRAMARILDRLIEAAGDTPITIAGARVYADLAGTTNMNIQGAFSGFPRSKLADGTSGEIFLRAEYMGTASEAGVMIHEVVHAALSQALERAPQLKAALNRLAIDVLKAHPDEVHQYGLYSVDPHEFLAEALSNPDFQRVLADTPAGKDTLAYIRKSGYNGILDAPSMWDALVAVVAKFYKLVTRAEINALDATLRITDELFIQSEFVPKTHRTLADLRLSNRKADGKNRTTNDEGTLSLASQRTDRVKAEVVEFATEAPRTLRTKMRGLGLKLGTVIQIGESANKLFGPDNLGTRLSNLLGKAATEKERVLNSGDRELVGDMAALQRRTPPEAWERFGRFLLDETMSGVFADAPVPKGDSQALWQGRAQHADLQRRLANELTPEMRAMRTRMHTYFRERQNAISIDLLKNIVRTINDGVPDDALAMKIFEGKLDKAEKAILEKDAVFKAIRDARAMSKINGPYVPLMREGDHVVSGRFLITTPGNATRMDPSGKLDAEGSVFQFNTKDEAKKFAEGQSLKVLNVQRIFTDPATGERFVEFTTADGTDKYKLTASDHAWGLVDEKYRVTVQDKYLSFFEREVHARQHHAEMSARTDVRMEGVAPRRWEPNGANSTFMSEAFNRALHSLQQRKGFQALDAGAKRQLVENLRNASLAALGSTRAQSHRLPRTFVGGASTDITSTTGKYASSSAGYLARSRFQPQVDATLKAMTDYANDYSYEATERTYPRGQILKELKDRVYRQGDPEPTGVMHQVGSRILQLSFLDKLASPAFHMINSAEPWTISMPVLAGRFKVGRTVAALNQAYRDIGALSAAGAGFKDTVKAFKSDQGLTNYLTRFQDRLRKTSDGKHVADMLEHLYDVGLLSRDAGLEIGRMSTPNGPLLGRGLDRADLMARQVGTAIESINRTVTAVAAYRLEFAKTKDHAKAKAYAQEIVHDTMGDYSSWNASPIFNHGLGRLALQFKKYAQKTYFLLGKTVAASLRGDKEAMKAFAGIMATHATLAGTLGLPLEVIKVGFIAANLLGVTNSGYDDFERWTRELAASALGAEGGQILTRGLPRYLGVDLSGRFGLESMIFPMGEPKSYKPEDLILYAGKAFAGAPISLLAEYPSGVKALWEGDIPLALEKLVPLKMFADSMQAYQKFEKGKQTPSGRETLAPYSAGEAATKVLGFTPGREAETGEMRGSLMGQQRQEREERTKLEARWISASKDEKSAMWRQINQWNQSQPKAAQITMKELTDLQQRRAKETKNTNNEFGFRTSARDQHIREGVQYYNVR